MFRLSTSIKGITAAFLLALMVYIPVEKNSHGHATVPGAEQQHQAAFDSVYSCLICDFQLGNTVGLTHEDRTQVCRTFVTKYTGCLPLVYFNHPPSCFVERGPPSFC